MKLLIELQMFRCGNLPFDAAQDVRYSHEMIVDHIGKMIRWESVWFDDNRIAAIRACECMLKTTQYQIIEFYDLRIDFEANTKCILIRKFLRKLHWGK